MSLAFPSSSSSRKYCVAVVQLDTGGDKESNLERVSRYIDEAAERGARLISLPEFMNFIGEPGDGADPEPIPGPTAELLMEKARRHRVYIHGGSFSELNPEGGRPFNTTVMIDAYGAIVARYRKLHTFDVTLPDGTVCRESARVHPGDEIVTAETELGRLGFAVGSVKFAGALHPGELHAPHGEGPLGAAAAGSSDRERLLRRRGGSDRAEAALRRLRWQHGDRSLGDGDRAGS